MSFTEILKVIKRQIFNLRSETSPAEQSAENYSAKIISTAISELPDRSRATVQGIITSLVVRPYHLNPRVEIELSDATGTITVIWLGRDRIHSIVAGAKISVTGFVGISGAQKIMYNPSYTIHATQEELDE